jgi:phospholipase C
VTDEFIGGLPIGPGPRVPMIICSPWTRGGFVDSNSYDHTSMLRFLETWTGVKVPNVTGWRRSVTGDLTAAFDFGHPDFSVPALPDTVPLITQSDAERNFPAVTAPAEGAQAMPAQEPGTRPHRPARFQPHADVTVNRSAFTVTATLTSTGPVGVSLQVFPDKYLPAAATPFTVVNGKAKTYQWSAASLFLHLPAEVCQRSDGDVSHKSSVTRDGLDVTDRAIMTTRFVSPKDPV